MEFIAEIFTPANFFSFLMLVALEVTLGIDNLIFLSLQCQKLPPEQQKLAQRIGLFAAAAMRILLLFAISWLMRLEQPLFTFYREFSGKDCVLIGGGLYLLWHATKEIREAFTGEAKHHIASAARASFASVIASVMLLDLVFSVDSVITAVGMVKSVPVMVAAIVTTVLIMLLAAAPVTRFLEKYPTFKNLALTFLMVIGVVLVADGFGHHVPKGLVYSLVGFGLFNEVINTFGKTGRGSPSAPQRDQHS